MKDKNIQAKSAVTGIISTLNIPVTEELKAEGKKRWEKLEAEESKMVKGKFICHELPGGAMTFPFKKFKSDPMVTYTLRDGEIYEIPLSLARHLNTGVAYPTRTFRNDEQGRPVSKISEMVRRCSFQSLDFL